MNRKPCTPNLHTSAEKFSKEEHNKIAAWPITGNLTADIRDLSRDDIAWESEQVAKSHGIYLEFNRDKEAAGTSKEWIFMLRISIPGGGPLTREQYNIVDDLTEKYTKNPEGRASIRLTNRQNIQFHWVRKSSVPVMIKALAESGLNTLNGCGDNTRNVMGCPIDHFSDCLNTNALARRCGSFFQLPVEPFISVWQIDPNKIRKPGESFAYGPNMLNRKFKIGFATVHKDEHGHLVPDNCAEVLSDDMGVVPVVKNNQVVKFQIYVGGSQGERNGKPSMACFGQPLAQVDEADLLETISAVVKVHQQWGDRENRHWARVKFVVKMKGIAWYREQVEQVLGKKLELPDPDLDPGPRHMHHGWIKQPSNGLWAYGMYIENGRIIDGSPNGDLKSLCRHLMNTYPVKFMITPNQDALFIDLPENMKSAFEADLKKFEYGQRNGKPFSTLRLLSGACVGRNTCRLTYTDSEKFEPELIDQLEAMGWGDLKESIGITGCERQCFRPATKTFGLVGSGFNRYQLKLMGSEDARHQGLPMLSSDGNGIYLRSIPRERVAQVLDVLLKNWKANARSGEDVGYFHRRIGMEAIISHLKENPVTSDLMVKTFPADCVVD
ncbi:MAG: nitrite/sulfite reductase [Candidatus Omnitrophica bacterium]|nr:nitrite/sulfite reductase [Candidatus Omnitrophota bacterium]MDE2222852.1 nitrite/sulfite reductase [Candidatus Omnitrophota bacterium]